MPAPSSRQQAQAMKNRTRKCVGMTFPFKLYEMLEDMAQEGDDSIVSWRPHGKAFTVHRPDEFVEKIMPYYFKQSRYKSFQRQLNLYGFVCLPRGDDKGSYFHKNFARGERYLCHYIVRKKDQRSTPRTSAAKKQKMEEEKQEHVSASSIASSESSSRRSSRRRRSATRTRIRTQPAGSLHSRQQEAMALLDRQVGQNNDNGNGNNFSVADTSSAGMGVAMPPQSSGGIFYQQPQLKTTQQSDRMRHATAPLQIQQPVQRKINNSGGSDDEEIPEDIMKVFNSIEVPPLECPSVGMFDDEADDIQIAKKQPSEIKDKEFQNEIVSLFGEEPAPLTNSRSSVTSQSGVPRFVQWNSEKTSSSPFKSNNSNGQKFNMDGSGKPSFHYVDGNFKDLMDRADARDKQNSLRQARFGDFGCQSYHFQEEAPTISLRQLLENSKKSANSTQG